MAFRCYVQNEKDGSNSRFYKAFVNFGGKPYYVIPGSFNNPSFVFIGETPYFVKGEPDELGKGWIRYVDVKKKQDQTVTE